MPGVDVFIDGVELKVIGDAALREEGAHTPFRIPIPRMVIGLSWQYFDIVGEPALAGTLLISIIKDIVFYEVWRSNPLDNSFESSIAYSHSFSWLVAFPDKPQGIVAHDPCDFDRSIVLFVVVRGDLGDLDSIELDKEFTVGQIRFRASSVGES